jgi:hypothetical protein
LQDQQPQIPQASGKLPASQVESPRAADLFLRIRYGAAGHGKIRAGTVYEAMRTAMTARAPSLIRSDSLRIMIAESCATAQSALFNFR